MPDDYLGAASAQPTAWSVFNLPDPFTVSALPCVVMLKRPKVLVGGMMQTHRLQNTSLICRAYLLQPNHAILNGR